MAAKMDNNFRKPDPDEVEGWYKWVLSLDNKQNPFHPTDGDKYWNVKNNDNKIIWLAGITATTRPAYKPNNTPNLDAVVKGSEAKVVYNDGNGKPVEKLRDPIKSRRITLNKGDKRDLYVPPSTELSTATKYPKLADRLSELAQKIIDREDPPAFVKFRAANETTQDLDVNQLKTEFRLNGTISVPPYEDDNVFMLPPYEPENAAGAFSEYAVILRGSALKEGTNRLKFGINGKSPGEFSYEVEYEIIK
jgi:hypothetical protein